VAAGPPVDPGAAGQGEPAVCPICRQERSAVEIVRGDVVHRPVRELIQAATPGWSAQDVICLSCLNRFRADYVTGALEEQRGELSTLEDEVTRSLKELDVVSSNVNEEFERRLTFGDRMADRMAEFGGSWRFVLSFAAVLIVWIAVNSLVLLWKPFDPFPYILLNLVLSCLAAIQAPVIMMSQNRQEAKDRLRAEHDYRVNLKAELEIRHLHWKMDELLNHQWRRLLEIQQIQTELMEQLMSKAPRG
jgi:uncharacterized membrane protein